MPEYEWTGDGVFQGPDGFVEPGETVELSEHQGEPQPDLERVTEPGEVEEEAAEVVEESSETEESEESEEEASEPPFNPTAKTVDDLTDELDDLSDEELEALLAAEQSGSNRETAIEAIEAELE